MSTELRYMPCAEFEAAIHTFVDEELGKADSKALLVHLELCDPCRDSVEAVRGQIRVHQAQLEVEKLAAAFDKVAFFGRLSGELLAGNLGRVADLLYELGKAYFVAGNDSRLRVYLHKKAQSVARTRTEGRRVARETATLLGQAATTPRSVQENVQRSTRLFAADGSRAARVANSGRTALDNARRYLEEALILTPDHVRARLYLGVYFQRIDRPEDATREYRKILASKDLDDTLRAMTLQALGNAYAYRRNYRKAAQAFEEILRLPVMEEDSRFFTVLVSLAMFQAKLERFERSKELFGRLVETYPQKVADARQILGQADVFRSLLRGNSGFRAELQERYPLLFAG